MDTLMLQKVHWDATLAAQTLLPIHHNSSDHQHPMPALKNLIPFASEHKNRLFIVSEKRLALFYSCNKAVSLSTRGYGPSFYLWLRRFGFSAPAFPVAVSQSVVSCSIKSSSPAFPQIFPARVAPLYWSLHFQHLGAEYGADVSIIYLYLGKAWCRLCRAEFPSGWLFP